MNSSKQQLVLQNRRLAKQIWGSGVNKLQLLSLSEITRSFHMSIAMHDILFLEAGWYVTHTGLIRLAKRNHCAGIIVEVIRDFCDPAGASWSFKATAYKSTKCKGFVGYGDANPTNTSARVRGAEMRVAETRAVNRALRKAYGIGLCSVEELGWSPKPAEIDQPNQARPFGAGSNGHHHGRPRLRDQLCLLIRQHNLDPNLVKAYAAHFCGTETIKEASRDLVESFISHLAASAKEDLNGLICKLNSFAQPAEVQQ